MKNAGFSAALWLVLSLFFGCGGGGAAPSQAPPAPPSPNIAGNWQMVAVSQVYASSGFVFNATLSEGPPPSGSDEPTVAGPMPIYSEAQFSAGTFYVPLWPDCAPGGMLPIQGPSWLQNFTLTTTWKLNGNQLSFVMTERSDGTETVTGNGQLASDLNSFVGTYDLTSKNCRTPAADHGTLTGTRIPSLAGSYTENVDNQAVTANLTENSPSLTMSVTPAITIPDTPPINITTLSGAEAGGAFQVVSINDTLELTGFYVTPALQAQGLSMGIPLGLPPGTVVSLSPAIPEVGGFFVQAIEIPLTYPSSNIRLGYLNPQ
jgi:hypothetical protein